MQINSYNKEPCHSADQPRLFHPFLIYPWQSKFPVWFSCFWVSWASLKRPKPLTAFSIDWTFKISTQFTASLITVGPNPWDFLKGKLWYLGMLVLLHSQICFLTSYWIASGTYCGAFEHGAVEFRGQGVVNRTPEITGGLEKFFGSDKQKGRSLFQITYFKCHSIITRLFTRNNEDYI